MEQISSEIYRLSTNYGDLCGVPLWLYLVRSSDGACALLDAGIASTPEHLDDELIGAGATLADITVLVNSHAHADHMGGDAAILARSQARLAAPLREVEWIEEHDRYLAELWHGFPGVLDMDSESDTRVLGMCGIQREGRHTASGRGLPASGYA